ncbi:patatin-like phospholipase family protein [Svornostia abyssi]|uniref:Patatin-like phospholipase family protein n=1 Tax=Svornostia abyssi TaxID=2898438 RepID=A0ABY5PCI5_9ACTN|nr:patatin-like phospholipase family protein [Parviterribacteraceae bacterium J379]
MSQTPAFDPPDVLVLGAGGTLGIAWTQGLLAGLEDATGIDFRRTESFIGTSAGAFVAASLVGGRRPTRPGDREKAAPLPVPRRSAPWRLLSGPARYAAALAAPWATPALGVTRPGGTILRAAALRALPAGHGDHADLQELVRRRGARWDGRLRVCAVDRRTGRRVVFGSPGAPKATVDEAVAASCTVPWIHQPVRIGDREYVDGGVWSVTNLDIAPAGEGTRVLCLNPTASLQIARTNPYAALRAAATAMTGLEALRLRARGAQVHVIGPAPDVARVMGGDLMDERRRPAVLAGAYEQGLGIAGS